ncbi:MAG TPA: NusA-like transcription termination signal-binding factor [Candidatus Woesearchaeota archaeon]|nr:NusA-like transcription termination signal-binding factor [Candidatus Woesearchaeota archaeon]
MGRQKINLDMMKYITLFESVTSSEVKDCFEDPAGSLFFVVGQGEARKAIGKSGANVRKASQMLNKRLKVVEFSSNAEKFIMNLLYPIKVESIKQEDKEVVISDKSIQNKSMIIGRNAQNLRFIESVVKRYFDIDEIKVV